MRMSGAGVSEHAVAATMEYVCRMAGARCAAFPPVVAAGANATILHYVENQSRMYDGQLLLVDSGSEVRLLLSFCCIYISFLDR